MSDDVLAALPSAARITDPAFRGNPRWAIGEQKLVMKQPRLDGDTPMVEEWVCELTCSRLGAAIGVPVARACIEAVPGGLPRLGSVVHSFHCYQQVPADARLRIANLDQMPGLFVFDQLVFNADRREDHIFLTGDPAAETNVQFYGVDHGHTLLGPSNSGVTVNMALERAAQLAPISIDYRIAHFGQIEPWIARLGKLSEARVAAIVDDAAASIIEAGIRVDLQVRVAFRAEVVKAFLSKRLDALPNTLRDWWATTGRPWGEAGTLAAETNG